MRTARQGAQTLLEALSSEATIAAHLDRASLESIEDRPGPAQLAATGPRAGERAREYELLLEMIIEGSRLHYGPQRLVRTEDQDLALLLGDQLYALGLARLAALGDLEAVAELAEVISLVAEAQAGGDRALADAVWGAGAVAIGWGQDERHALAKRLARAGDRGATRALREAALVTT